MMYSLNIGILTLVFTLPTFHGLVDADFVFPKREGTPCLPYVQFPRDLPLLLELIFVNLKYLDQRYERAEACPDIAQGTGKAMWTARPARRPATRHMAPLQSVEKEKGAGMRIER